MTDESPPIAADFFDQLNDAADEAMPKLLERLKSAVDGDGQQLIRIRCTACGAANEKHVEVADIEETRKIVELFGSMKLRAAAARKTDEGSTRARTLLHDLAELTNEEIAEAIAALEAEVFGSA